MNNETKGTILAIVAAVVSGLSIPLNKIFVVNMDPLVFTALRSIVVGAIFLGLSLRSGPVLKKVRRSWKYLISIAIVGGSFAFLLFFTGLKLTTAGRGAFLQKTLPIYVALLAFLFLKEKLPKKYLYSLALMFIGTCLIYFTSINPTDLWSNPSMGDLLIIAATILWSVESVISKKAMLKGDSNFIVSFSRMFFGGLILFGILILSGNLGALMSISMQQVFNIFLSTAILFCYVFFWYSSMSLINVSKASSLLLIAPVISTAVGVLVLGEPLPLTQILGSAAILLGAYYVSSVKSELSV
jgi:drug/metabolite transporter (DMT)-like permease